jgi:hypothetical protein
LAEPRKISRFSGLLPHHELVVREPHVHTCVDFGDPCAAIRRVTDSVKCPLKWTLSAAKVQIPEFAFMVPFMAPYRDPRAGAV